MISGDVQARMRELIERYYLLNRVPVSDDTSSFVRELAGDLGAGLLSVPSGEECLTWIIPPKWVVHEAYLETLGGERVVDFSWNPLNLKSYSAPFSGEISRAELLKHVVTDNSRPESTVYDYRSQYQYGDRTEWGFSMPYAAVQSLSDSHYRVRIDTEFQSGVMEVIDWILPGESTDTIFFAAHTCHPAQVNDGIAGIAVLVELFRWLQDRDSRRYTYRMILGPEYFAAAALLQHANGVEKLKYGFFLDMLASGGPLGFSRSYCGDSYADTITPNVLKRNIEDHVEAPYRGLWGNDEMFYDGPDFQIPTICIGRANFENYHTDKDNLDNCDFGQLAESLTILRMIVEVFETDCVPVRLYRGPLYQSRYGLYIDPQKDREGAGDLQMAQILMDGTRSCVEIAEQLGIDYWFVRDFVRQLQQRDLVDLRNSTAPAVIKAHSAYR